MKIPNPLRPADAGHLISALRAAFGGCAPKRTCGCSPIGRGKDFFDTLAEAAPNRTPPSLCLTPSRAKRRGGEESVYDRGDRRECLWCNLHRRWIVSGCTGGGWGTLPLNCRSVVLGCGRVMTLPYDCGGGRGAEAVGRFWGQGRCFR